MDFGSADTDSVDQDQPNLDAYDDFEMPGTDNLALRPDPSCPRGMKISCCRGNRCVSWNVSPDHQYCSNILCCSNIDWTVVLDDHDPLVGKGIDCNNQPAANGVKGAILDFLRTPVPNPLNGVGGGGGGGGGFGGAGAAGGAALDW